MPRRCTICDHPERDALDHAIAAGTSYRRVALQWGVSRDAIGRHAKRHLSPALAAMQVEREADEAKGLLQRTERLIERTERLLLAAEQDGKVASALSAVRELRGLLELLGKATGELRDAAPTVTVNLQTAPEWLEIRALIFAALTTYPEARAAVAGRLLQLGDGS